jgi:ketosteroid isomerase-like protein
MNRVDLFKVYFLIVVLLITSPLLLCQFTYDEVESAIKQKLDLYVQGIKQKDIDLTMQVFSPDVVVNIKRSGDWSYLDTRAQILEAFSKENFESEYTYSIREIIVEGDIAIVRLVWKLRTTNIALNVVVKEREDVCMDIFKCVDDQWQIIRQVGYFSCG